MNMFCSSLQIAYAFFLISTTCAIVNSASSPAAAKSASSAAAAKSASSAAAAKSALSPAAAKSASSPAAGTLTGHPGLPATIRVSTIEHAPYIIKDAKTNNYSGFLIDVMDKVTTKLGVKYKIVSESDRFGVLTERGEWNGVIDDVIKNKAEVALASLTMTKSRLDVVEFSIPILRNGFTLVRSSPRLIWQINRTAFFCFTPFSTGVWVCVLIVFIVTVSAFTANSVRNPRERAQRLARGELGSNPTEEPMTLYDHLSQSAWFVLSTSALQSATRQPMSVAGRVLALAWWMFIGLTLCTYIVALLVDIIASGGHQKPAFTTVTELMKEWNSKGGYRVYFSRDDIRMRFKKNFNAVHQFVYAHSQVFDKADELKGKVGSLAWMKSLLNESDKNLVVMSTESTQRLLRGMDCGSLLITQPIDDYYLGLVFRRNATQLRVAVNKVLLAMAESGELRTLNHKWGLMARGPCGLGFDAKDPSQSIRQTLLTESVSEAVQGVAEMFYDSLPISMNNFAGILVLYFLGLVFTACGVALDIYFFTHPDGFKHNEQMLATPDSRDDMIDTPEFQGLNDT